MGRKRNFFHYFDQVDRDDSGLIEQNEVECEYLPYEHRREQKAL